MKKTLVSLACTLALALGASAQTVTFAELPSVRTPTVLPNNFANLDWSGFYYVSPSWVGADAGFRQGPAALNVGFMGGGQCELADVSCSASISSASSGATASEGFRAQSAIVAAGNHSETIKVSAYSHGHFVGSEVYNLTASLQTMNFPPGWGAVTQLVVDAPRGTVVFYALDMESASATAGEDVGASAAPHQNQGPSAPGGIVDPPPPMDPSTIVSPPIIVLGPAAHNMTASPNPALGAQPDDVVYTPGPSAIGKPQPDDLKPPIIVLGPAAHNMTASPNPALGAQPDDVVYTPGPSAIGKPQPDDMIQKPVNPNAVRTAQPQDMIYPGSHAVRGAQVDPNAGRKVEPD